MSTSAEAGGASAPFRLSLSFSAFAPAISILLSCSFLRRLVLRRLDDDSSVVELLSLHDVDRPSARCLVVRPETRAEGRETSLRKWCIPRGVPKRARLVLLSFLMLFVELALIRWTGSNIIYLSYFSNFVLLGSFLGIGIGFLSSRSRFRMFQFAPLVLALLVFLVLEFPVSVDRTGSQLIYFGEFRRTGCAIWIALPGV